MYEEHFNFKTKPFDLLPNPDLLYLSNSHGKALSYLRYGIQERAGFILLSGEVGAGKTTLVRELIKRHLENVTLARVFNTRADSHQLLTMINDDFGLDTEGRSKAALLRDLNEFLIDQYAAGKRAVLIIDEAQNLSMELLEEIRMLSNLETDGGKLLQIVLVGQPELRDKLNRTELKQLRQRIQIGSHLKPLGRDEVAEYIHFRMEGAGNRDALVFAEDALDEIFKLSRGIPRLINILCDYILIDAFANESSNVTLADVSEIAEELDFERQYWPEAEEADEKEEPVLDEMPSFGGERKARKLPKQAYRVFQLLNDLESRIELLESEVGNGMPADPFDLMDRLEKIEGRLKMQQDGLESVKAMYWNTAAKQKMDSIKQQEEEKSPPKRGWVSRLLFGGE